MTKKARQAGVAAVVLTFVASIGIGAAWVAPAGAKLSADDCEALLNGGAENLGNRGSNLSELGSTADQISSIAKDISDKKLKSALQTLASVYKSASRARSQTAAALVLAKSGKKYAKAAGVFGKAITECVTSQISNPTVPTSLSR